MQVTIGKILLADETQGVVLRSMRHLNRMREGSAGFRTRGPRGGSLVELLRAVLLAHEAEIDMATGVDAVCEKLVLLLIGIVVLARLKAQACVCLWVVVIDESGEAVLSAGHANVAKVLQRSAHAAACVARASR